MVKTPRITLYSTAKCAHCRQMKDYLRQHKIPFGEQDIERNRRAFTEFQRHGGRGVPLLVIGQQLIRGFNQKQVSSALTKAGFSL